MPNDFGGGSHDPRIERPFRIALADMLPPLPLDTRAAAVLVAKYTLDTPKISGTSVIDVTGNGHTATIHGSPTLTTGISGDQAINFTNTNGQYLQVPSSAALQADAVSFTWEGKNLADNGLGTYFFNNSTTSPSGGVNLVWLSPGPWTSSHNYTDAASNSNIQVRNSFNSAPLIGSGTHRFVLTYDPNLATSNWAFYVDEVSQTVTSSAANGPEQPIRTSPTDLFMMGISSTGTNAPVSGIIDKIRIYTGTLTQAQINYLALEQDLVPGIVTDSESFYAPKLNLKMYPALMTDAGEAFRAPAITTHASLTPGLISDTDTFYAPSKINLRLTAALATDSDSFFAPSVLSRAHIVPGIITDTDSFFVPVVTKGAVTLAAGLISDTNSFYAPSIAAHNSITPNIITDTEAFYAAMVTPGAVIATAGLVTVTDTFYVPNEESVSHPALVNDTDSFAAPTVLRGTITLTAALVTDSDSVYAPALHATYALTAGLITDTNSFFAPAVVPAAWNIAPSPITDSDSIFAPAVSATYSVLADIVIDVESFYGIYVSSVAYLLPSAITDSDSFFAPIVRPRQALAPALISDSDQFFVPAAIPGSVGITPPLYADSDSIYAPNSAARLHPGLIADTDSIPAPSLHATSHLTPALYVPGDQFRVPHLTSRAHVLPGFISSTGTVFAPSVKPHNQIVPVRHIDAESFKVPAVHSTAHIRPGLIAASDSFAAPIVRYAIKPAFLTAADQFQAPLVSGRYVLTPSLATDPESFWTASARNVQHVLAGMVIDGEGYFTHSIGRIIRARHISLNVDRPPPASIGADRPSGTLSGKRSGVISIGGTRSSAALTAARGSASIKGGD